MASCFFAGAAATRSCSAVDQWFPGRQNENGSSSFSFVPARHCQIFTKHLPFSLTISKCCQRILQNCPQGSCPCPRATLRPAVPCRHGICPERLVLFPLVRCQKRVHSCPRFSICCSSRPTLSSWIASKSGSAPLPRPPAPACAANSPNPPPRWSAANRLTWSCSRSTRRRRPERTRSPDSQRPHRPRRCSPSLPGTTNRSPCRRCAPAPRTPWSWTG